MTLLAQNTQTNHAVLAGHVPPFNPGLDGYLPSIVGTDLASMVSGPAAAME